MGVTSARHIAPSTNLSRPSSLRNATAVQYYRNDHVKTRKIEDRLKQWHAQMGNDSKTQIRPLTQHVNQ